MGRRAGNSSECDQSVTSGPLLCWKRRILHANLSSSRLLLCEQTAQPPFSRHLAPFCSLSQLCLHFEMLKSPQPPNSSASPTSELHTVLYLTLTLFLLSFSQNLRAALPQHLISCKPHPLSVCVCVCVVEIFNSRQRLRHIVVTSCRKPD